MQTVLIRGGRVIDPARGFDETADVVLDEGMVAKISTTHGTLRAEDADQVIDAEGCIVAPGLIDMHVHLREPSGGRHEETIATGTAAAIAGGFTGVCCMPNTTPPLDSAKMIRQVLAKAGEAGQARVLPAGCATAGRKGAEAAPIAKMAAAGAMAITDDGGVVADAGVMEQVLRAARDAERCCMQHCQEPSMTRGSSMNAGRLAERLGEIGWPAEAEEIVVERDIDLNREIGCRYHVQHISAGGSVKLVRDAQREGEPVTAEVSPHHLLLTEAACEGQDTNAKMNPPLRRKGDIKALKEGVADGTITILATDHAPHPRKTKDVPFAEAAFGIVGLDCALPLYVKALIEGGVIDWPAMLAMMTINPARLLGADRIGLGTLVEGGPADVTVIDPDLEWTIEAEKFASTGRNCPFEGWEVKGKAVAVVVAGEVKMCVDRQRVR
ncbi:MAG: dihydroorotase [Phycisphaerales bacterium]|nr:MAG: dihydroorotase [Phycisphaerales bacterium]